MKKGTSRIWGSYSGDWIAMLLEEVHLKWSQNVTLIHDVTSQMPVQSSPDLPLWPPDPNILSQAHEFLRMMLKTPTSCWTSMIRNSSSISLLEMTSTSEEAVEPGRESEERSMKVRNVTVGVGTDWSWHQGVRGPWFKRAASSNNWTRNYEDACLSVDSEG